MNNNIATKYDIANMLHSSRILGKWQCNQVMCMDCLWAPCPFGSHCLIKGLPDLDPVKGHWQFSLVGSKFYKLPLKGLKVSTLWRVIENWLRKLELDANLAKDIRMISYDYDSPHKARILEADEAIDKELVIFADCQSPGIEDSIIEASKFHYYAKLSTPANNKV